MMKIIGDFIYGAGSLILSILAITGIITCVVFGSLIVSILLTIGGTVALVVFLATGIYSGLRS